MYRVTLYSCDVCSPKIVPDDRGTIPNFIPHSTVTIWEDGVSKAHCSNCGAECRMDVEELVKEE